MLLYFQNGNKRNGGIQMELENKKGFLTRMSNGIIIVWRKESSSDGSPAVSIRIIDKNAKFFFKEQKIHFVKKGD